MPRFPRLLALCTALGTFGAVSAACRSSDPVIPRDAGPTPPALGSNEVANLRDASRSAAVVSTTKHVPAFDASARRPQRGQSLTDGGFFHECTYFVENEYGFYMNYWEDQYRKLREAGVDNGLSRPVRTGEALPHRPVGTHVSLDLRFENDTVTLLRAEGEAGGVYRGPCDGPPYTPARLVGEWVELQDVEGKLIVRVRLRGRRPYSQCHHCPDEAPMGPLRNETVRIVNDPFARWLVVFGSPSKNIEANAREIARFAIPE